MSSEPHYLKFVFGGISCMSAACVTNPIDVIKTRLQLQGELTKKGMVTEVKYKGFVRGIITLFFEEGFRGLYKGITPSLLREGTYSTLRMGFYEPFRDSISGLLPSSQNKKGNDASLLTKILAGAAAGATGAAIANPTDLVKVRMQAEKPGEAQRYKNTMDAFVSIYKTEGIPGLYRGVGPTTQRAMLLTGTQLASYDHTKHFLLKTGYFQENTFTHFVVSFIAGFFCATTTAPFDTVKSRYMNQKFDQSGKGMTYTSTMDCFVKTFKAEGFLGLYKGWLPNWFRIGPHTVVTFLILEKLRAWAGVRPV